RSSSARAYGFRTLAQLRVHYRHSPAVQEGEPVLKRGPKAGDRLPDARVARDGQTGWLQDALATPSVHLLLCGPTDGWDAAHLAALQERNGGLIAVHRLAREAVPGVLRPGVLRDRDGQAFSRLGADGAATSVIGAGAPSSGASTATSPAGSPAPDASPI